jgi:hypothetical protein
LFGRSMRRRVKNKQGDAEECSGMGDHPAELASAWVDQWMSNEAQLRRAHTKDTDSLPGCHGYCLSLLNTTKSSFAVVESTTVDKSRSLSHVTSG